MASIGADEGVFSESEFNILQNILKLKKVRVTQIMPPRVVVVVADENILLSEFLKNKEYLKFSRIPVYNVNDENIVGYVFRQTVFVMRKAPGTKRAYCVNCGRIRRHGRHCNYGRHNRNGVGPRNP